MEEFETLSNITNSFVVFISMAAAFTLIVVMLLFIISHWDNECRHSRSDGQTVKFCYNDNLYCAIADPKQKVAESSISFRTQTQDTLSFGQQFQIGICYGSCVPETSNCISFGSQEIGYCTDSDNLIYLKGAITEPNFSNIAANLIASYIQETQDDLEAFVDEDEIIFVNQTTNSNIDEITSSAGTNGIFGKTSIPFESKQNESFFQPANENLLNVNKRLKNLNAFRKIESPSEAEGLSQTWACVDPSFIYPCNGRVFDGISMYCYKDGTSCVKFCSHGYHNIVYDDITAAGNCAGVRNLDNNKGYYQTTGFGSGLENSSFKEQPYGADPNTGKYTLGSIERPGETIPASRQISQSQAAENYLQENVFCGGITPGSTNNADDPINSLYPTPSSKGPYTIGF